MSCKKISGSFTVEASILLPFLLLITFLGIFLTIFIYDKTLLIQDTESVIAKIRMSDEQTDDIPQKHPYIFMSNLQVMVEHRADEITVVLSGDWELPLLSAYNQKMSFTKKTKKTNPIEIMFLTEEIMNIGEIDD